MNAAKAEEDTAKDHKVTPFPLVPARELGITAFTTLHDLRYHLKQSLNFPNFKPEELELINKEIEKVTKVLDAVRKTCENIERLGIGL